MKQMPPVMILCGGKGTRLREVTELLPKPMVPIGEQPIRRNRTRNHDRRTRRPCRQIFGGG